MAKHSLNHIVLSSQELIALNKVIIMGCDAFKTIGYPLTYGYLVEYLYHSVKICALGVTLMESSIDLELFSNELDKLADFMRKVREQN
jgi:hypothetical protein